MTVCFHLKDKPVNARMKINIEDYENDEQDRQFTNNVNTEALQLQRKINNVKCNVF
jgi:hypothetical protein